MMRKLALRVAVPAVTVLGVTAGAFSAAHADAAPAHDRPAASQPAAPADEPEPITCDIDGDVEVCLVPTCTTDGDVQTCLVPNPADAAGGRTQGHRPAAKSTI
jgi:hypothetical protein